MNFTRFAASGGSDRRALGRSVRAYVKKATGGSTNAARRMGASRRAAANIVDVFARLERDGVQDTFKALNIDLAFLGTAEDALLALTDIICSDGGPIDEAIARDAWCETVAQVELFGITDIGSMTDSQRREVFASFVAKTIELRILNDIGAKGFKISGSPNEIRNIHRELYSYIETATKDQIMATFPNSLANVTQAQMLSVGDGVYDVAWSILETYRRPPNAAS